MRLCSLITLCFGPSNLNPRVMAATGRRDFVSQTRMLLPRQHSKPFNKCCTSKVRRLGCCSFPFVYSEADWERGIRCTVDHSLDIDIIQPLYRLFPYYTPIGWAIFLARIPLFARDRIQSCWFCMILDSKFQGVFSWYVYTNSFATMKVWPPAQSMFWYDSIRICTYNFIFADSICNMGQRARNEIQLLHLSHFDCRGDRCGLYGVSDWFKDIYSWSNHESELLGKNLPLWPSIFFEHA